MCYVGEYVYPVVKSVKFTKYENKLYLAVNVYLLCQRLHTLRLNKYEHGIPNYFVSFRQHCTFQLQG